MVQVMVPMISAAPLTVKKRSTSLAPQKALFYDRDYITSDRFATAWSDGQIPSLEDAKAAGFTIVGTSTNAEMSTIQYIWDRLEVWTSKAHALGFRVFLLTSVWDETLTDAIIVDLMTRSARAGADIIAFDELISILDLTKPQYDMYFQTALAINKKIQFIVTEWDDNSLQKAYTWFNNYPYVRIADDNYNDLSLIDDMTQLATNFSSQQPIVWMIFSKGSMDFHCYLNLDTWMAYVKQRQLDAWFFKIDEFGTWKEQWPMAADYVP